MPLKRQEFAGDFPFLNEFTAPVKRMERPLIGREKELHILRSAMMRPELCNVILLAEAGSGKALADWTPIPVADERGYVPIHDIVPGDYVFDENGTPVLVKGVYPQGKLPAYLMTFSDGSEIVCNTEHIWHARQVRTTKGYQDLTLQEMMDIGITSKDGAYMKWRIPFGKAVEWPERELPVHPYVMGVLIAGGSLTEQALTVSSARSDSVVRAAMLLETEPVRNPTNYSWRFRGVMTEMIGRLLQSAGITDELTGRKASERVIPSVYLTGSVWQRLQLLEGLMDMAGRVALDSTGSCYFTAASKQMAESVQQLLNSLGYRAVIWAPNGNRKNYKVRISGSHDMKMALFYSDYQKNRLLQVQSSGSSRDDVTLVSVQNCGLEEKMTCIYVDGDSHLFQCGKSHLVTHNTALVQGMMVQDAGRDYMEVDLARMIANLNDKNEMAAKLKSLFGEVTEYRHKANTEVVLFIDEFHQVVQLSDAAVEALKPLLADSGTRGVRVIAATTYEEFRKWISPNLPLVERLQRINLAQPGKEVCVEILKNMAKRYNVDHQFYGNQMFEAIYDYTNRYMPAASQPRKSILLLDAMIGWHRAENRKIDRSLLADVIMEQEGINVAFRVDATTIKSRLDARVYSQQYATSVLEQRLQICVADLNDKTKPLSSFLFTGSTGVGKTEMAKALAELLFNDERNLIRFDMTEYANADSLSRFRSELTNKVWTRPHSIILLDEIEKACSEVTRILLQVLDDGRLIDDNNREVTFTNAYIIMTTNAGSEIYRNISQYNVDDTGSGKQLMEYMNLIRESISRTTGTNKFPPELLGRIDCVVPFQPLSIETLKKIIENKMRKLITMVREKHGVRLLISKEIMRYIVEDNLSTDSDAGGARVAVAKFESEVTMQVARFINRYPTVTHIQVDVEGEMAVDNQYKRISEAHVVVNASER